MQAVYTTLVFHFERKEYLTNSKHLVLVFSGWGNPQWLMFPIAKILNLNGFSAVTYTYDVAILTPDIQQTLKNFSIVQDDVLETVKKVRAQQVSVLGMSIGTILAFMVANKEKQIQKVIANLTGADTTEVVWTWDTFKPDFKKAFTKHTITLAQLKKHWQPISPVHNLSNFQSKKVLLYFAEKDEVIPYEQATQLLSTLKKEKIPYEVEINKNLRHLPAAFKNMLFFQKYISFLKK